MYGGAQMLKAITSFSTHIYRLFNMIIDRPYLAIFESFLIMDAYETDRSFSAPFIRSLDLTPD